MMMERIGEREGERLGGGMFIHQRRATPGGPREGKSVVQWGWDDIFAVVQQQSLRQSHLGCVGTGHGVGMAGGDQADQRLRGLGGVCFFLPGSRGWVDAPVLWDRSGSWISQDRRSDGTVHACNPGPLVGPARPLLAMQALSRRRRTTSLRLVTGRAYSTCCISAVHGPEMGQSQGGSCVDSMTSPRASHSLA